MIKYILDLILAQLISSRTERWYVSSGLGAIITNSGLELRSVKYIVDRLDYRLLLLEV